MHHRKARALRLRKSRCLQVFPAAPVAPGSKRHHSTGRWRRSHRANNASPKQFVERRALLLFRLFIDSSRKVLIELTDDGVQPSPVLSQRLEDDGIAVPANANLLAFETKVFRQSHRLRASRPENFRSFHDHYLMSYINDI